MQHKRRITIEFKPGLLAPAVIPILLASFSLLLQFTVRQKRKLPKNCCNYLLVSSTIGVAIVTYNARCVFYGDHINLVNSLDISYQHVSIGTSDIHKCIFFLIFRHFGLFCSSPFTGDIKTLYKTVFKMRIIETIFSNW